MRVIATNVVGDAEPSDEATGTPQSSLRKVTGLTATPAAAGKLELSWNEVADVETYVVQWKSGAQEYNRNIRQRGTGPVTSYTITCLNPSTEYTVRVAAFATARGRSDPSDEVMATPLGGGEPPIASAGPDQTVNTGDRVTLNGLGSNDPDGCEPLSASWTQLSGASVRLNNDFVLNPTFTAPATACELRFRLQVSDGETAVTDDVTVTVVSQVAEILRIEPSIRSIALSAGDKVRLSVDVYGRQGVLDNRLADDIEFEWRDGGDKFSGNGRSVTYTAPESPGSYTVTASFPNASGCVAHRDGAKREAEFEIKVRRPSVAPEPPSLPVNPHGPIPVNPHGPIPVSLADSEGVQYEVFTPEDGGTFFVSGEAFRIAAGPGAVPNGEIIGISMSRGEPAFNVGQTHHRYTLAGDSYDILAVDASGQRVSGYTLRSPAQACIPLPDALRSNISDVAIAATDGAGSLTILSSTVRVMPDQITMCGNISSLPAIIAAATLGAPSNFPTPVPEPGTELSDTGGGTPSANALLLLLIIGAAALAAGLYPALRRMMQNAR